MNLDMLIFCYGMDEDAIGDHIEDLKDITGRSQLTKVGKFVKTETCKTSLFSD